MLISGFHWKIWFLGGAARVHEKPIYWGGGIAKKGATWTACRFKGWLGGKERGGVFLGGRGWYPNAYYETCFFSHCGILKHNSLCWMVKAFCAELMKFALHCFKQTETMLRTTNSRIILK